MYIKYPTEKIRKPVLTISFRRNGRQMMILMVIVTAMVKQVPKKVNTKS